MHCNIGIDVSKTDHEVFIAPQNISLSYANTPQGISKMIRALKKYKPQRIVLEATAGYERPLVLALGKSKQPGIVLNPRQVRNFARSKGILAKTDRLDAKVLADFAATLQPPIRTLDSAENMELKALSTRRKQIVDMIANEKNHLENTPDPMKKDIEKHLRYLNDQLKKVENHLDKKIQADPKLKENDSILKTVPGVGPTVSKTLLVYLPELGHINRKQIAALAGLAPMNKDSGRFSGQRSIQGGRSYVRSILYMAALSAIRCNPIIAKFYNRLCLDGKRFKVAIVACMRKLLTILNAMIHNKTSWYSSIKKTQSLFLLPFDSFAHLTTSRSLDTSVFN